MDRTSVFIDGGYLDKILKAIGSPKVDYLKLAKKLCGNNEFLRAYYYQCLPYQGNPPTADEARFFGKASYFIDKLKRLERFEIRLGKLVKRGIDVNGKPIFIQKRVDVYLATDLVKFSAKSGMQMAVILTSDSDYVPAIQAAKEFNVIVKVAYFMGMPINDELLVACDERLKFDPQFFDDILR